MRTLTKDPDRRFPSFAALRTALFPYSSSASTPATLARRLGALFLDHAALHPLAMAPLMLRASSDTPVMASIAPASCTALWILARQRNGYAGLHELASGTRVRSMVRKSRLAAPEIPLEEHALSHDLPARFGPYRSRALLWRTDSAALLVAHDDMLNRSTWIHCYSESADAPSTNELGETRMERLYWLNGSRGLGLAWDAFERPSGCSLASWICSRGPLSWAEMREILLELSAELERELHSGRTPRSISAGQIWVTAYGQAKVLGFPARPDDAGQAIEIRGDGWRRLLYQITLLGLERRFVPASDLDSLHPRVPLPEHAQPIVESLWRPGPPVISPGVLAADLRNSMGKPARLTPARRVGPGLVAAILPIMIGSSILGLSWFYSHTPDWMRDLSRVRTLERRLQKLDGEPNNADAMRQSSAIRTIMAATYWKIRKSPQSESHLQRLGSETRSVLEAAAKQHANPSEAEIKQAREIAAASSMLDSFPDQLQSFKKAVPFGACAILGLLAIPATVLSMVLRGGLMFHMFGITVNMKDGRRAPRYRCAVRALASLGMYVLCLPLPPIHLLNRPLHLSMNPLLASLPLAIGAACLIYAALRPARGIPDLLAGTVLVPK